MKTTVTRTVIVIMTSDDYYVNGIDEIGLAINYTMNIKWADEFETIAEAEKALTLFNSTESRIEMNAKIKTFTYEVDEKFLMEATEIKEIE